MSTFNPRVNPCQALPPARAPIRPLLFATVILCAPPCHPSNPLTRPLACSFYSSPPFLCYIVLLTTFRAAGHFPIPIFHTPHHNVVVVYRTVAISGLPICACVDCAEALSPDGIDDKGSPEGRMARAPPNTPLFHHSHLPHTPFCRSWYAAVIETAWSGGDCLQ